MIVVFILGLHATLFKWLELGIFKNVIRWQVRNCQDNILWNVLYVNNFVEKDNMVRIELIARHGYGGVLY